MSDALLTLLRMMQDDSRPAWERSRAGRTLMAKIQGRITQIDAEDLEKQKRRLAREADAFARRSEGEA